MCGIAGKFSFTTPGIISLKLIQQMIGILNHRGPDESGFYLDDWIGLGHCRLSIIDLAGGTQPIHNEDYNLWLVYNGEVFNYPELKVDLLKKGHRFYTNTDSEVILHLYEEKGPACLNETNGQFALAIWDRRNNRLFLARDRLGIRPLFYTFYKGSLVFASEIKAILMDQQIERAIEPEALDQIFTFWTTLSCWTIFKNILELPAGHYLIITPSQFEIQKYWDIPFYPVEQQLNFSLETLVDQARDLLLDSIRIRLRADVPVGCYLSGGLDSSGVTTMVLKKYNQQGRTFGIRFEENTFDEGNYQSQMVSFLNAVHTEIQATNEKIGTLLPKVIWHCEKPVLRTAPVPLFMLSQLVHEKGYKVVLTGEGADEIFGGYNIFRETKIRNFCARQPKSKFRTTLFNRLYPYIFTDTKINKMVQSFFTVGLMQTEDPFYSHSIRWQNTGKIKQFLHPDFVRKIAETANLAALNAMLPTGFSNWEALAKAQYLEMSIFLTNYLLSSQGDRVAMANSVEIRLPYLDYRLVDFMGRVPAKWKIRGLNEKYLLKKIFNGILPESIIHRSKQPYRAPIHESLMNGKNAAWVMEMLSDKSLKEAGIFHEQKVQVFLKKMQTVEKASEVDNMALIGILTTQLLYTLFIKKNEFNITTPVAANVIYDYRSNQTGSDVRKNS